MFDDMAPWEKGAYIAMLTNKIEEENEKEKMKQSARRAAAARPRR